MYDYVMQDRNIDVKSTDHDEPFGTDVMVFEQGSYESITKNPLLVVESKSNNHPNHVDSKSTNHNPHSDGLLTESVEAVSC